MEMKCTLADARKMSEDELQSAQMECREYLEKLGMDHVESGDFICMIMNIGIALQEIFQGKKKK